MRRERASGFLEPLEFLVQILNGGLPRPMALPRMNIADALSTKRIFFGRNAIEIRGAGPQDSRFGAMVRSANIPPKRDPIIRQSPARAARVHRDTDLRDRGPPGGCQIDRVSRQVDMSDEAGSIVAEHL